MRYSHCGCGGLQCFGSDPPFECMACKKCGNNGRGQPAKPHNYKLKYSEDTGLPKYYRCTVCLDRAPYQELQEPDGGKAKPS